MNAIILAAGMGTRLRPLTNDRPKCLVEVKGVPMVERQIQCLKEKGIDDITLISGYKSDTLDFLKDKYGVDIVFNDRYETCNNINSLFIVRDRFHDTYVMEGDVYMDQNVLLSEVSQSTYFAKKKEYKNEWGLKVDENNRLTKITVGAGNGLLMSGISYWAADDCKKIIAHMEDVYANKDYTNLYWDNMVLDIYSKLDIYVKEIDGIYEIDTLEELKEVELATKVFNTGETAKELMEKYNPEGSVLRKSQLRMLDMLLYIDKICKEQNIEYCLDGGNVLGAVRHGGFIPWDDDVDITLTNDNYKKLCKYLKKHKHHQYVLQDHSTDSGYYGFWSVLRDTKSEYLQDNLSHKMRKYRGLQIDIFPIEKQHIFLFQRCSAYLASLNSKYFLKYKMIYGMLFYLHNKIINSIFRLFGKLFGDEKNYFYSYGSAFMQKIKVEDYYPYSSIKFEGVCFPAPHSVDGYLKGMYGSNYMELPPIDKRDHHHAEYKIWD